MGQDSLESSGSWRPGGSVVSILRFRKSSQGKEEELIHLCCFSWKNWIRRKEIQQEPSYRQHESKLRISPDEKQNSLEGNVSWQYDTAFGDSERTHFRNVLKGSHQCPEGGRT